MKNINVVLAKIFNFSIQGKIQFYIAFNLFLLPLYIIEYCFMKKLDLAWFMQIIMIPMAMEHTRLSETMVYNKLFKIVSMSLKDINRYKEYDYDLDKDKISEDFKKDFIKGLINRPLKKTSFTTHKWVVNNVVNSEEVKNIYNIDIKKLKMGNLIYDVLILAGKHTESAYIKRQMYKVTLTRK